MLTITAPDTVIVDAVYVLRSQRLYNLPKSEIADLLIPVVSLPGFRLTNRRAILRALRLYGDHPRLDFTDALIIVMAQQPETAVVYSYDRHHDGIKGLTRKEPAR